MSYKHTLADVIACCIWPPETPPRELIPPTKPYHYDDDVDVPVVEGRAGPLKLTPSKTTFGERVLTALRRYDTPVTAGELAQVLQRLQEQVSTKLRALEIEGVVERIVRPGLALHWRLRPAIVVTLKGRAA